MGAARVFRQSEVPKQPGELARLKVVRGPDQGAVFVITEPRVGIGRGEDNAIMLADLRTSRRHAEIVLGEDGSWSVRDLGSANGIILNGAPSRAGSLRSKDTIAMGETILEFMASDVGTVVLTAPAPSETQLRKEQHGLNFQRAKIAAMARFGGLARNTPEMGSPSDASPAAQPRGAALPPGAEDAGKPSERAEPRKLLLLGALLMAGYLLMTGGQTPRPAATPRSADPPPPTRDLASYLPMAESPQVERMAEIFYKSGFREYTQGNWMRAETRFETVLQMAPAHALARLYLEKCRKEIDNEVKTELEIGRNDLDSGKLKEARGNFEDVLRLKYREPTSPDYIQARQALDKITQIENAPQDGGSG